MQHLRIVLFSLYIVHQVPLYCEGERGGGFSFTNVYTHLASYVKIVLVQEIASNWLLSVTVIAIGGVEFEVILYYVYSAVQSVIILRWQL